MSTRSLIALKQTDGTVKSIYCHWDGYVSHNGRLLIEHYATPEAVEELLALGPLSALHRPRGRITPTISPSAMSPSLITGTAANRTGRRMFGRTKARC